LLVLPKWNPPGMNILPEAPSSTTGRYCLATPAVVPRDRNERCCPVGCSRE